MHSGRPRRLPRTLTLNSARRYATLCERHYRAAPDDPAEAALLKQIRKDLPRTQLRCAGARVLDESEVTAECLRPASAICPDFPLPQDRTLGGSGFLRAVRGALPELAYRHSIGGSK